LQAMPADATAAVPSPPTPGGAPAASAEELQKQREGLKRSMEKAVELAPKVQKLSGEAAGLMRDRKPADALPKQQEALTLLKEIAEPLPKQKQQPNQDDQQKQDQSKQEQNSQPNEDQKQPDPKQQQQDASQQQTEAAIRQVQQRQQKRQEMEKQLQRYQASPGKVDKDW